MVLFKHLWELDMGLTYEKFTVATHGKHQEGSSVMNIPYMIFFTVFLAIPFVVILSFLALFFSSSLLLCFSFPATLKPFT